MAGEVGTSAPISAEILSELIGSIYDCAIDPDRWAATLGKMCEVLLCQNAALALSELPSGRPLLTVSSGIEKKWLDRMPEYAADMVDQWGGHDVVSRMPLDTPVVLSRDRTKEQLVANRYFREWGRPQFVCDVIGVTLSRDSTSVGTLGFGRNDTQGLIGAREIEVVRLLIPHLQRSVAIGKALEMKSVTSASFEAAMDAMAAGIMLVDANLRILHANRAALNILVQEDPISSERGVLAVRVRPSHIALARAVRQAIADEAGFSERAFGIPVTNAEGRPAVLHVLALRRGRLRPNLSLAAAAIFISPGSAPALAPEETLAALFGLTAAEARVFSHIGSGSTVAETARRLGVRPSTARTHLLRVLSKTGTRRQADLIRLIGSLASPV